MHSVCGPRRGDILGAVLACLHPDRSGSLRGAAPRSCKLETGQERPHNPQKAPALSNQNTIDWTYTCTTHLRKSGPRVSVGMPSDTRPENQRDRLNITPMPIEVR